ncbi:Ferredoxin-1 [compost metagenome]
MVHIHFKNTDTTVTVQYPDSILDAGLNAGLHLPHSCRSGQCGTCAARIVKGEVWIQYNEVLTHKDLENGLTLTCMGFPINGDVTITYD